MFRCRNSHLFTCRLSFFASQLLIRVLHTFTEIRLWWSETTNFSGDLANKLIHPRYEVEKWYEARLHRPFDPADRPKLAHGVRLREGYARINKIKVVSPRVVQVMLKEGMKREVRRIFARLDYTVQELCRVAFGPLLLGDLPPGAGRFLTPQEVRLLRSGATGIK